MEAISSGCKGKNVPESKSKKRELLYPKNKVVPDTNLLRRNSSSSFGIFEK